MVRLIGGLADGTIIDREIITPFLEVPAWGYPNRLMYRRRTACEYRYDEEETWARTDESYKREIRSAGDPDSWCQIEGEYVQSKDVLAFPMPPGYRHKFGFAIDQQPRYRIKKQRHLKAV